jgi:nucleoside-diphosphate-sugar epimerase
MPVFVTGASGCIGFAIVFENQERATNHVLSTTGSLAISAFAHSTYSLLSVRVIQSKGHHQ